MNTAIGSPRPHEPAQTPASNPRRDRNATGVVACRTCDLLTRPSNAAGTTSLCPRCGAVVHRQKSDSIDRPLAFALSGLILFAIALTHPFLAMKSGGFVQETTLLTGIFELWKQHLYGLGALVLLTCALIPLAQLTGLLYILVPLRLNTAAPGSIPVFRAILHVNSWAMMEVFVVGILVALVKLAKMATIVPGVAVMALGLLTVVTTAAMATLDPPLIWSRLDRRP